MPFQGWEEELAHLDVVIAATGAPHFVVKPQHVEAVRRKRKFRPLIMVDIAVPRDIESQVGELRDVYLYSVDDLREIVDQNMRNRQDEAGKADGIIAQGVRLYLDEIRALAAVDTVKEYRQMAEQLREQELQRVMRSLKRGDDPGQLLAQLSRAITNKLIHAPSAGLKKASAEGRHDVLESARQLLGIEPSEVPQTRIDEGITLEQTDPDIDADIDTDHTGHT